MKKGIKNKKAQMLTWDVLGKYIIGAIILVVVILIIKLLTKNMGENTNILFDLFPR